MYCTDDFSYERVDITVNHGINGEYVAAKDWIKTIHAYHGITTYPAGL